jgi:hypothetical protein
MTLDICSRIAEQYEDAVLRDHRTAMLCRDAEEAIRIGVIAIRAIKRYHLALRELMHLPHTDFQISDSLGLTALYRRWLSVTSELLPLVEKLELEGYHVERVNRIREYFQEVSMIQCDVMGLSESFKRLEAGEGLELDEFFDSLSHQG